MLHSAESLPRLLATPGIQKKHLVVYRLYIVHRQVFLFPLFLYFEPSPDALNSRLLSLRTLDHHPRKFDLDLRLVHVGTVID